MWWAWETFGCEKAWFGGAQFYILRKLIEAEWGRKGFSHKRTYCASLSSQTIVYKGQLMPSQVPCPAFRLPNAHFSRAAGLP